MNNLTTMTYTATGRVQTDEGCQQPYDDLSVR